ncbi:MAG: transcription termination factor NusA, partial [Acidobacteriota bacterium]|nr:transcription termination factor NusA [Acidobacteriota bacterium]
MSSELYHTIEQIGREKGIEPDVIIQAIEEAYAAASRKYYKSKEDFGARFDRESGEFVVFSKHTVVEEEELMDPQTELTVEEAREIKSDAELGDVIETVKPEVAAPLSRIAAQAAKQVIYQKVKEAEREIVWKEYGDRIGDLITGQVKRFDRGDMILDLGRTEGIIPRSEQSRAEHYNPGERVRAILINVERLGKGPQLILSRASELLVKKLFEQEVPEIYDGTVSVVSVARDAGERSKVAVKSKDRDVDPVGACVGMKGSRVQAVIRELRGEKIDIVQYDEDSSQYVRNALNPAVINRVAPIDYETREMEVIVGEDQLSLAIGKKGQNVRLAGKLAGWRLDIKSEAEKKAEIEAEMERMARANRELSALPGIGPAIANRLLEVGFRAIDEVAAASLSDLTGIEGIGEAMAIKLHDAAEEVLEQYANGEGPLAEIEAEEQARAEEAARIAAEEAAAREAALAAELEAQASLRSG